jgi:hypothetical protein
MTRVRIREMAATVGGQPEMGAGGGLRFVADLADHASA